MLESLSQQLGQLEVKSPLDGMVLNLPARAEQVVTPGTLLVRVGNTKALEVKADILSDDLAEVKIGQSVVVTAPVLGSKSLSGLVKQIYPEAQEKTSALGVVQRRVPVIISLPDAANLQAGYEVRVAIATAAREKVVRVPLEAVRTDEKGYQQVMAVVDGKVKYQTVKTGISDKQYWEVKSGLKTGETLIRDGGLTLKEGARVKPVKEQKD